MILSGLSVVKSKSLKAAGFADITELGFMNEKWVENELWLAGPCSSAKKKKNPNSFHTLAIHLDDSITWQVTFFSVGNFASFLPYFDISLRSHEWNLFKDWLAKTK